MPETRPVNGNGWVDCGTNTLTGSDSPSDGVRGRFTIPSDLGNEFNISADDEIELRVFHDGRYEDAERPVYQDKGIIKATLPLDERRKLGLEVGDEVEYWMRPVTNDSDGQVAEKSESASDSAASERTLYDAVEEADGVGYVVHVTGSGATLHARENGAGETICGKQSGDVTAIHADTREQIGGGEEPDECQRCADYTGGRSVKACRKALSDRIEQVKYDPNNSTKGYFDKDELPAIIGYIEELERRAEADSEAT